MRAVNILLSEANTRRRDKRAVTQMLVDEAITGPIPPAPPLDSGSKTSEPSTGNRSALNGPAQLDTMLDEPLIFLDSDEDSGDLERLLVREEHLNALAESITAMAQPYIDAFEQQVFNAVEQGRAELLKSVRRGLLRRAVPAGWKYTWTHTPPLHKRDLVSICEAECWIPSRDASELSLYSALVRLIPRHGRVDVGDLSDYFERERFMKNEHHGFSLRMLGYGIHDMSFSTSLLNDQDPPVKNVVDAIFQVLGGQAQNDVRYALSKGAPLEYGRLSFSLHGKRADDTIASRPMVKVSWPVTFRVLERDEDLLEFDEDTGNFLSVQKKVRDLDLQETLGIVSGLLQLVPARSL